MRLYSQLIDRFYSFKRKLRGVIVGSTRIRKQRIHLLQTNEWQQQNHVIISHKHTSMLFNTIHVNLINSTIQNHQSIQSWEKIINKCTIFQLYTSITDRQISSLGENWLLPFVSLNVYLILNRNNILDDLFTLVNNLPH